MTAVTGWRVWDLSGDGSLRSPMMGTKWAAGPVRATCAQGGGHAAPDPRCRCGIKVAAGLEDLLRMVCLTPEGRPKTLVPYRQDSRLRPPFLYPPYIPEAVSQVTLGGRILGPADDYDRPGTIRAEYATVKGPLYFARESARLAAAAADLYGCDVVVSDLDQPGWMTRAFTSRGGLYDDIRAHAGDPGSLGPRLHRPGRAAP
jgi:hypothetical protein